MTFNELDTKGKIEHIWEYYRLRIFMIIFLLAVAVSFIYSIFIKPHPDLYCGMAMYGQFISIEDNTALIDELNQKFQLDPREYTVDIQSFYSDDTDPLVEAELNQKFNTYIYASQFHLLLGSEENINAFVSAEFVSPLSDYLTKEEISQLETQGKVLYAVDPATNENKPMAVNISNSALLKKYNLYSDTDCYVAFVPMPDNGDHTMNVFNTLLEE
ncbi:MAG: hypothetical protein Q4F63_09200 [Clostridia bacterium]|nr:hypothetical protein [Clostridia bacterium]